MKTFADLEWKTHPVGNGKQGKLFFPNGFGVSVVQFKAGSMWGSYTDNESEWELAVLEGSESESSLTYLTPITDDVLGHLTEQEVTDIMKRVQELPAVNAA